MIETTYPRTHYEAISALRERGEKLNFVPRLPHSLFAYERLDLIGKVYKLQTGQYGTIEDAAEFDNPHYIFDGIALKINGYWRYGCPEQFIKGRLGR